MNGCIAVAIGPTIRPMSSASGSSKRSCRPGYCRAYTATLVGSNAGQELYTRAVPPAYGRQTSRIAGGCAVTLHGRSHSLVGVVLAARMGHHPSAEHFGERLQIQGNRRDPVSGW